MRTKEEQETIILYDNANKTASVYTCDRSLIKKLTKLMVSKDDITLERQDDESATFIVPRKWIKVQPPKQVNFTEEQRALAAERLRQARNT